MLRIAGQTAGPFGLKISVNTSAWELIRMVIKYNEMTQSQKKIKLCATTFSGNSNFYSGFIRTILETFS